MHKEFITMNLDEIIPYENNPRFNDEAVRDVVESIKQTDNLDPIEIDENNVILSGHTRMKALQKLGYTETQCIRYSGLTDEQKRKYRLLANKTGEKAEWDFEKLEQELEDLDFDNYDFGFESIEINDAEETEIIEDEVPEEAETRCKLGDIWQLGTHRLICGDSTDVAVIDSLMDGAFARMTITSPPYGVGKDYEQKGIEPWRKTIGGVINAIKGKTLIVCWNIGDLFSTGTQFSEPTGSYSIQMFDAAGYGMLYNRIWKKPGANFAGNNPYYTVTTKPAQDYEYLYAFAEKDFEKHLDNLKKYLFAQAKKAAITDNIVKSIGGPAFMCGHWFTNHQWALIDEKNYQLLHNYCCEHGIEAFQREYFEIKREYLENTIFSHSLSDKDFSEWGLYGVWEFNTVHERLGGHAAAFPVELPTRFIKMHSYEEDIVLDPFGGTGTTLIACEQLNRKCYMCELDPKYCSVILQRYINFKGSNADVFLLKGGKKIPYSEAYS